MSYYQVTVDGEVLADQSHPSFRMSAGKLKQQISNAGSLSITIPKKNTVQRRITKMESVIEVLHDERPIWSGRCNAVEESSVGKVKIGAEGMLCALKDTILAPQTFSGLDYLLFDAIIAAHNSAARNVYQRFTSFVQHAPYFVHTLELKDYTTAWAVLEAFLKECGGFYLPVCSGIDMKNGILWDCQFTEQCEQVIREGVGLLSFKRTQKADGTYNAILPTGKLPKEQQTEGGDNNLYLTGYSYSNGLYVSEASSKLLELDISPRFRRVMYKHYSDIETQAELAAAAVHDLEEKSKESDIVEAKALDMSFYDPTVPPLELGKLGRVCATRFDYDDWLPVVERELDLVKPQKSTVVLGGSRSAISSMTGGGSSSGGSVSSGRSSEESAQHAVLYVVQELTNNQKAVARQNIGAASASDIPANVPDSLSDLTNDMALVLYDRAQNLNDTQKAQFRENIGAAQATPEAHRIYIEPDGSGWKLSDLTGNTWQAVYENRRNCALVTGDTTIGDRTIKPDYVCDTDNSNSAEIGFSWQRYDGSTAEGVAFILTAPSNGSTGTIRRITGANIGSGGTLTGAVRYDTQQSLQTTEKGQARSNIGAGKTTVSVSGNTMTIKDEESGTSSTHSLASGGALPAIAAGDAFKHLRVKYDESGVEWAAVEVYHKIFFYNEDTGAVTKFEGGAATGANISESLNTLYYSTYIIGFSRDSSTNDVTWNYYLPMDDFAPSRSGLETVRFYRQTTTGIEVLSLDTSTSTATKTTIASGGGSGSAAGALMYSEDQTLTSTEQLRARRNAGLFNPAVGFLYSNGKLSSENGEQTGASIVSRYYPSVVADRAAMFAFDISFGKIYWLDSVNTTTNTVVFKRTDSGVNTFLTVSGTSSTVTESTSSAETYVVSVSDNGSEANPRYTLGSGITPSAIVEHINNIKLLLGSYYRLVNYGGSGNNWTVIFGGFEVNANGGLDAVTFRLAMTLDPSSCTITKRSTTVSSSGGSSGGGNLIYDYVTEGSYSHVILRGAESPASGNMIVSMMASENAVPVVFVNTLCYYYHGQDSGSVIFRRIDNARKVEVGKTSGIATESAV